MYVWCRRQPGFSDGKSRLSSAPSPLDQIPYVIFKKCPPLHAALLSLFQECWKSCRVPNDWKIGVVKLIPKSTTVEDPRNPANYRPIALTSCVSKLFTSIIKRRLESFVIGNGYINFNLQKAFVPGIPGCHDHQFKVWRALQDAKASQRSLCAVWLDLKNAYGSVHHQLIQYAMSQYHVSEKCQRVVACLYSNLTVQVRTPD